MNSEITNVKSFFQSIQVHLSDIWLESCMNWCKSEVLNVNYTIKELQSKIYEQWLLLDLRDVEVSCLPPNLSLQKYFVLNGNFCVQMMCVMDISKPKLWQLQKIRNRNALTRGIQQESDSIGTGKRMLQLTLTDGVQEVEAMEYKPISSLGINLAPGVKIRIMGPVIVRRGRLMLEQQNVKILGGEVEELLVSHAAENVLAKILKLPENPNPAVIDEKLLVVERAEEREGYKPIAEIKKSQLQQSAPKVNPHVIIDEDEEEMEIENILLEAERNVSMTESNDSKTPDLFENDDFNPDELSSLDQITNVPSQVQLQKNNMQSLNDDTFNEIDVDAYLDEVENRNIKNQFRPTEKILTIAELVEMKNKIDEGIFKVRAKFKSVVEKLTLGEEEYKLTIAIEDHTSSLIVKVHNDLISEFAGYSLQAMQRLKTSVIDQNESAVEKVMNAIQKVKNKFVALNGIMMIKVAKHELPIITKME